jgi:hypothetical protein
MDAKVKAKFDEAKKVNLLANEKAARDEMEKRYDPFYITHAETAAKKVRAGEITMWEYMDFIGHLASTWMDGKLSDTAICEKHGWTY